ncbi:MAG: hypothetical protein JJU28_17020 [Cyclobacteriaceae bacterium]|nr:hypothetical protein [Cyclobacteriaceae bacterium]
MRISYWKSIITGISPIIIYKAMLGLAAGMSSYSFGFWSAYFYKSQNSFFVQYFIIMLVCISIGIFISVGIRWKPAILSIIILNLAGVFMAFGPIWIYESRPFYSEPPRIIWHSSIILSFMTGFAAASIHHVNPRHHKTQIWLYAWLIIFVYVGWLISEYLPVKLPGQVSAFLFGASGIFFLLYRSSLRRNTFIKAGLLLMFLIAMLLARTQTQIVIYSEQHLVDEKVIYFYNYEGNKLMVTRQQHMFSIFINDDLCWRIQQDEPVAPEFVNELLQNAKSADGNVLILGDDAYIFHRWIKNVLGDDRRIMHFPVIYDYQPALAALSFGDRDKSFSYDSLVIRGALEAFISTGESQSALGNHLIFIIVPEVFNDAQQYIAARDKWQQLANSLTPDGSVIVNSSNSPKGWTKGEGPQGSFNSLGFQWYVWKPQQHIDKVEVFE